MATSKPDILIILLQKLMEEGNLLYKVSTFRKVCLSRATYRTKKKKETVMDDLVLKAERTNQAGEVGVGRGEGRGEARLKPPSPTSPAHFLPCPSSGVLPSPCPPERKDEGSGPEVPVRPEEVSPRRLWR